MELCFPSIRWSISTFFLGLVLLSFGSAKANELSISVPKISPLFIESDQPVKPGVITSRLDKILREAGYSAKLQFLPWKRAESSAISGTTDGTILWTNIGHLDEKFSISLSFMTLKVIFLTLSSFEGPPIGNYLDVADMTVGTLRGDTLEQALSGRGIPFTSLNSIESAMNMLQAGRVGALLIHKNSAMNYLKKRKQTQHFRAFEVGDSSVYFAVSQKRKDADKVIKSFNTTLMRLRSQKLKEFY